MLESEDEQLARAIAASLGTGGPVPADASMARLQSTVASTSEANGAPHHLHYASRSMDSSPPVQQAGLPRSSPLHCKGP